MEELAQDNLLEVRMDKHSRLGDALCVMNGLEIWHRNHAPGTKTVIHANSDVFSRLLAVFPDFKHLTYGSGPGGWAADQLFGRCSWHRPWPARLYHEVCNGLKITPGPDTWMPKCAYGGWRQGSTALAQLDTRSGTPLPKPAMRRFIRLAAFGQEVAMVCGHDTGEYAGGCYTYYKGTVEESVKRLLGCSHFIGVDSGMAHLAGFCGVPAYITNCCAFDAVFAMFGKYKDFRFVDRALLNGGKGI